MQLFLSTCYKIRKLIKNLPKVIQVFNDFLRKDEELKWLDPRFGL